MLFPIFLFLMTLSPLYIPVGATLYDQFDKWRSRRGERRIGSVRRVRLAAGPVPAAA